MTTCLIGVFAGKSSLSLAMPGIANPVARMVLAQSAASLLLQDRLGLAFILFPLKRWLRVDLPCPHRAGRPLEALGYGACTPNSSDDADGANVDSARYSFFAVALWFSVSDRLKEK